MQITINIGGREALPLRAIPYVTSWNEAPDSIVHALLGGSVRALTAHQADAQGNYDAVPASQWEAWRVTFNSLTAKSKADERAGAENENWDKWRNEATLKLPDNVFVWLDEFQQWFSKTRDSVAKESLSDFHKRHDEWECRLVFDALVGQVVQLLQHQHFEHEYDINRLGARAAFAFLLVQAIKVRAERLPVDLLFQPN